MSGEAGGKPIWNSLEIAKIGFGALTPLTIFFVGQLISAQNEAERQDQEKIAAAELKSREEEAATNALIASNEARDRDITKTFSERLRQADICKSKAGITLLVALATPECTKRLSDAYKTRCPGDVGDDFEKAAVGASQRITVAALINNLESPSRHVARRELTQAYQDYPVVVGEMLAEAVAKNLENYRITLGVLVVLGSVGDRWDSQGPLGPQFAALARSSNQADSTFSKWYEKARTNKK